MNADYFFNQGLPDTLSREYQKTVTGGTKPTNRKTDAENYCKRGITLVVISKIIKERSPFLIWQ